MGEPSERPRDSRQVSGGNGLCRGAWMLLWVEQGLWGQVRGLALAPCPPCPGTIQSYCARS